MNGRTCSFECPITTTTNMSSYSANSTSNLSLDPGLFRQVLQGTPSVSDKAYTLCPHPSIQSTLHQVVYETHTGSPFAGVHQENLRFPVVPVYPSGSCCTTFIKFINSSPQGYESVWPVVSLIPSDDISPASVDRIRDWPQEGVSMGVSLGHTHQSAPAHPTSSDLSARSALPVISCGKTVVQDKEQRVPKWPHHFQKTETDPAAALSRSSPSPRPGEKRGVSQDRYSCSICNRDYAQPQGLTRHQCEKHKAKLCIYCREFAWGRPYLFRKHLVKRHPGIDADAAIDEAARTRRSATIRRGYPPLPQVPIPTPKCNSWDRAESQSYLNQLTSPPARPLASTVTRHSPVFLPEMANDSQSESTVLANKEVHGQEDALPPALLIAHDEGAASSSTGEHAEAATNLDIFAQTVQMWVKEKKQSISLVGVDSPSKSAPALAPVPTPTPPLNGYGSPAVVSPIVEQAERSRYSCHSPLASVVERSGRTPSPPLPIWCNWADISPAGTPGPLSYI